MLEYSLIHAIANGQAWLCGPEKLKRLAELVTKERKQEVEGICATPSGSPDAAGCALLSAAVGSATAASGAHPTSERFRFPWRFQFGVQCHGRCR
jgi:hypothetical protein